MDRGACPVASSSAPDAAALDAAVRDALASGASSETEARRSSALATLERVRADAECWKICLRSFQSSKSAETQFWCLQTLVEALRAACRGAAMSEADATTLRIGIGALVGEASDPRLEAPAFVKNKLAQACALSVALEYPSRWPSFFSDVANLFNRGASGVDMFTRILEALDEEVIATVETGRTMREDHALSMRVKDAMRADGSLQLVFDAWRQCLQHFLRAEPRIATRIWSAARRYVEWVDLSIVASDDYVRCARECLMLSDGGSDDANLLASATSYLHAVITKGMDIGMKVRLIASIDIIDICASLQSLCATRESDLDEEFVTQATNLSAAVGSELLNAQKMENIQHLGTELSAQLGLMLHRVTPIVLSSINFRHERAVLVALPFLTQYIGFVKSQPALLNSAQPALAAACQALIARGAFPLEETDDLDWNDGSNTLTQEFEAEVFSLRTELNVQLRNIARLVPQLAREMVRQVLTNALVVCDGGVCRWQNVEVAVSALYTLGEGADDAAVKPMSNEERAKMTNGTGEATESPLGALAVSLIRGWNSVSGRSALHRLVAPVFLETCVRYHAVLEKDNVAMISALTAFLDERGIGHRDRAVRSRACYLLSRLVRPLRCKLSDRVDEIMQALHSHLSEIARTLPEPVEANAASVSMSASGIQSRAMAESGNDDRLYLFEAAGVLLGAEELSDDEQYGHLSQIASALCLQIDEVAGGTRSVLDDESRIALSTRSIIAIGNVSKGFTQRTCVTVRPRTGEVFRSCLHVSLRCLDVWPRVASVRSRVTGFLHRMIDLLGPSVTPYLAPTVERLRQNADAAELRDTLVLFNQLTATYKTDLAPLVVQILPSLADQIFSTISGAYTQASALSLGADVAKNTETVREADELERMWLTTAAALGTSGLLTPTFTGRPNAEVTARLREQILTHLLRSASTHPAVNARKVAMQALKSFVEEWLSDERASVEQTASKNVAVKTGPRDEILPGFTEFVVDAVCVDCCVVPPLRGDLNLADAAAIAVLNECFAILAIASTRKPTALASALHRAFSKLLASDGSEAARVVAQYLSAADAFASNKPHARSSKPARALVAATSEIIRARGTIGPPHECARA